MKQLPRLRAPRARALPLPANSAKSLVEMLSFAAAAFVLLLLALFVAPQARAQGESTIIIGLTSDKFPETERALNELPASDLATAPQIVEALAANRLYFQWPGPQTLFCR